MKRFWHSCLAVIATALMAGTSGGQEIGSYQSILARAGYGTGAQQAAQHVAGQAATMASGAMQGGAYNSVPAGYGNGQAMYGGTAGAYGNYGQSYGGSYAYGTTVAPTQGATMGHAGMMQGTQVIHQSAPMVQNAPMAQAAPVQTGQVIQGGVSQAPITTGHVDTGMVSGGYVDGGMVGTPVYSAPMQTAPVLANPTFASVGTNYADCGPVCAEQAPVYVQQPVISNVAAAKSRNLVLSVFGVVLRRDYEDPVKLAYDYLGRDVFSTDVEHGRMSGLGVHLISRSCSGTGFEAIYWGLDEEDNYDLTIPTNTTALTGYANLYHPSGPSVLDVYNQGESVSLIRSTEIHNFEFNLLRNGGCYCTRFGRTGTYELIAGFRLFRFNEDLRYQSNTTFTGYPTQLEYNIDADNTLTGFQVGGRSEICLSNRLRMNYGGTVGLFNNFVETRQQLFDNAGFYATNGVGGPNFDYSDTKNDAAMLGQFDAGLIYHLTCSARLRAGYRALGVSGVALAADQIPYDFTDVNRLSRANSNGSLLLHGLYFGSEFCF